MTDTTAAPEDRCVVRGDGDSGAHVFDRVLGSQVGLCGLTWSAAHSEAQRLNRKYRAALNKPAAEPAAPCDCAAKLKAAEDKAERYRHALAQITRYSPCPTARRYADEALFATERAMEASDGT